MKIKIEVEDNEFPEWPPFPRHLVLMWAGIREDIIYRVIKCGLLLAPPLLPLMMAYKAIKS